MENLPSPRAMAPFVSVDLSQDNNPSPSAQTALQIDPHDDLPAIALRKAISEVSECRARLKALGEPPQHDAVEQARLAIVDIDARLSLELESLFATPLPEGMDQAQWSALQIVKEKDIRDAAEIMKSPHEEVIQLDKLNQSYELLLKKAEENMVKLCDPSSHVETGEHRSQLLPPEEDVNDEVVKILRAAQERDLKNVDLKGRGVTYLPEAFGKILTIVTLDLSNNELKDLSDSIGGLYNMQTLNLEKNSLESLPDSVGLLKNLKVLNVCTNKLTTLPESILQCSALVSIKAGFNELAYLPTNIGFHLLNLEHLSVQLNKLRVLPASICNLKSLRYLDVNFNQLKSLPAALGNLTNLEILDASRNFKDLETVPDTIGDLVSLTDLNLSYNQIQVLPDSFGRLQNLKKLNIEENPLLIPPMEVVEAGVEAVMTYMRERWKNYLMEEEQRHLAEESPQQSTWLPWGLGGSWLTRVFSGVSDRGASSPMRQGRGN